MDENIQAFLAGSVFAVAGASARQHKYGNKIFRALLDAGRTTFPLNPVAAEIEGHQAYPNLSALPVRPESLSIVTPPEVTRLVTAEAIEVGVRHIWMQPGAEDAEAIATASDAGLTVIADGSCILVALALL